MQELMHVVNSILYGFYANDLIRFLYDHIRQIQIPYFELFSYKSLKDTYQNLQIFIRSYQTIPRIQGVFHLVSS